MSLNYLLHALAFFESRPRGSCDLFDLISEVLQPVDVTLDFLHHQQTQRK